MSFMNKIRERIKMKFERFEEIIAWQKSKALVTEIYRIFNKSIDYNYKNQILRASISVMNNIAEGFERKSNNEFKHFLFIAKGSSGEVRSMLYLGMELNYITQLQFIELKNKAEEISKMISGLIKTL